MYAAGVEVLDEPVEDVAHGRLARLQAVHAGHDRAGHDAAQAGDVGQRLVHRGDHHVAGAGADDLHQRARLDARPDRAHVGVEGADGHRHARRQADLPGHLGGQPAGLAVGRQARAWRSARRSAASAGIELRQELLAAAARPTAR